MRTLDLQRRKTPTAKRLSLTAAAALEGRPSERHSQIAKGRLICPSGRIEEAAT